MMMARPSKAPAAPDDSSDGEGEEDEGGDERQPSDDELAQKPKETEDIPDDGGGKQQPAVMQPGIGHVPPSAEQQLSPEGNVASRASPQGGHAEDDKTSATMKTRMEATTMKAATRASPFPRTLLRKRRTPTAGFLSQLLTMMMAMTATTRTSTTISQCKKMSISPEAHRIDGGKTSRESVCSNGTSGACSSGFVTRWKEVPSPGTEMAP
mmetsp:Transcript_34050/g.76696  ORF Transcript_34050/g.76696 Transcript_34050/m.76696 type:complete len:210 (-) Transcript_34050:331-960(-)